MRYLTSLAAIIGAAIAFGACGSESCIVTANSGNKLCGDDAAAWCDSTDAFRDMGGDSGDFGLDQANRESVAACDEVRGE